jgi:hypothetical protein
MKLTEFAVKSGACLSVNPDGTDKEFLHLYLSRVYEPLFQEIQPLKNFLEIGIGGGSSIKLWTEYLSLDRMIAIDAAPHFYFNLLDKNIEGTKLILGDAYSRSVVKTLQGNFDIIVDDGPHAYWSLKAAIRLYFPKLRPGGVMVVEDIPNIEDVLDRLLLCANSESVCCFWLIDSRADAKLQDDSVALVIHRKNGLCKLEFNKGVKVSSPKFSKSFKLKGLLLFERFLEICNRKIYHGIKFRITRIKKRFLNKSLD